MKSSFSNLSVTSPTSQLIFQPFRCFTYVTVHSATLLQLLLSHKLFTYLTWRAAHAFNVYFLRDYLKDRVLNKTSGFQECNFQKDSCYSKCSSSERYRQIQFKVIQKVHTNLSNLQMVWNITILQQELRVIGNSGSLIWSKTKIELVFNPCGEFR